MDKELFEKYINTNIPDKDLIKELFGQHELPDEMNVMSKRIWHNLKSQDNVDSELRDAILDKIHHRINLLNSKNKNTAIHNIYSKFSKIAAILILPIILFASIYIKSNYSTIAKLECITDSVEVVTPIGSKTTLTLIDGTIVHLNNNSKLIYPAKFVGNSREVRLEGEGYFKVAHNAENPFIVKTNTIDIKALGTEFNVKAYNNDNNIETTLVNGKVVIEKSKKGSPTIQIDALEPGYQALYDKTKETISKRQVEAVIFGAWKEGQVIFNNEPIVSIAQQLERMFNVEITFNDEQSKSYTYKATLIDPTLNQVLELIKIATPIDYDIVPIKQKNDGTYYKKKIIVKSIN